MNKVFFSASQQGNNKYHCSGMTERQYCERLVDRIMAKLPPQIVGICNHSLNYAQRPRYAAQQGCDAYVTIHTNGFNGKARGLEIGTSRSAQDKPLAEAIYKVLESLTPAADRGIKRYTFTEAVEPIMPSCYIEISFHDNHEDEQWLLGNVEQIAEGIITGLCTYLKIPQNKPTAPTQPTDSARIAEFTAENERLRVQLSDTDALRRTAVQNLADMAAKVIADVNMYTT